jgi:hypothetical protein
MYHLSTLELQEIKNRKEKPCTTCGVPKNINEFGKKSSAIDGRASQCLQCQRKQQAIIRMGRKLLNFV